MFNLEKPSTLQCIGKAGKSLSSSVLLVEDFGPFRQFIRATLGKRQEFHIICEVSDGLEAVHKAEELKPDLILIDIGLPTLNGIEAARRIRRSNPDSRIVFLSQESSADVIQEALSLGALGYVVKARAGNELVDAMEAVLHGRRFISKEVSDHDFPVGNDANPQCGSKK